MSVPKLDHDVVLAEVRRVMTAAKARVDTAPLRADVRAVLVEDVERRRIPDAARRPAIDENDIYVAAFWAYRHDPEGV